MLGIALARRRISLPTWSASSRVGHSTSAWALKSCVFSRVSSPIPNTTVLPLPVSDWAMRSSPCKIAGRLCCCTGVITSYPMDSRLASRRASNPSVEKEVMVIAVCLLESGGDVLCSLRKLAEIMLESMRQSNLRAGVAHNFICWMCFHCFCCLTGG